MPTWNSQANDLFLKVLELGSPGERERYLAEACGGDKSLRADVESLLAADAGARGFLEAPAAALMATVDVPMTERPGTVIGPYKLLEQIGEGGFGVVFMAEQQQPVRRKVALKVLKPGMDTRQVNARFEAERQALALMDHPNIARVLDGGQTSSGRPYFVMDLVKGVPITEYCDQSQLTPRERLELFLSVCQAVQHAHQKGIIHRDIKPSNVLVTMQDGAPLAKIIDFGIAKTLGQQLTDKTLFTGFAQMIGTPLYMSPEQAALSNVDVDTRSDIYSLGVLLYELLTGSTPFNRERFKEVSYDEIRRIIREEEPPKPSTRISTLGQVATTACAKRKSDPRQLSRLFRGELDWIVMKALEKDRNRRYETANSFAQDIQRYLANEAVLACPPSAWYRLSKFARRNKTGLAVAGLILFFIASLGSGVGWAVRDRAARRSQAAKDLEAALDRAEWLQGEGKRPDALAAFARAELLAGAAAMDLDQSERLAVLRERLDTEARDQEFIAQFAEIRLRAESEWHEHEFRFSPEAAVPKIREALRKYGMDIGSTSVEESADQVRGRPEAVRQQLLAALDECLSLMPLEDSQAREWLLATLNAADNDPWRVRTRKALLDSDGATLEPLVREAVVRDQPPSFLLTVAVSLPQGSNSSRLEWFRKIQRTYPTDLRANHLLGDELVDNDRPAEAIRYYTAAIALLPNNAGLYNNRARALEYASELNEAIADYRQALALAPDSASSHHNLGEALGRNGQFEEAIDHYRTYFRQKAGNAAEHYNFGHFLCRGGQPDEGIVEFHKALNLQKDFPCARLSLAQALGIKGRLEEAVLELREAIRYEPEGAANHYWLGKALQDLGRLDEAIVAFRDAIRYDNGASEDHRNLGHALRTTTSTPTTPHEGQSAEAHCYLGLDLRQKGEVREALKELRIGHELGSPNPNWPYRSAEAEWVRQCERLVELDEKLPGLFDGTLKPASPAEQIEVANLCLLKRLNAAAARFFGEAFTGEPNLQASHRYNAACAAALAGCGQGKDADKVDEKERSRLRRLALDWLRVELNTWGRLLDKEPDKARPVVVEQMRHWQADTDFAGVRGAESFARLPEAERQPWQKLWNDVADLLQRAQEKAAFKKK
jgi:serine/threonine protein kinase/Flp pilus assembly protein TadD